MRVVIDAAALSALTSSLPHDVNPWTTEPVFITSIDFIKQPEVLRGLCLSALGHSDRRRGASGVDGIAAIRGRENARRPRRVTSCCSPPRRTQAMTLHIGRSAIWEDSIDVGSHSSLSTHQATGGAAANAARASASRKALAGSTGDASRCSRRMLHACGALRRTQEGATCNWSRWF